MFIGHLPAGYLTSLGARLAGLPSLFCVALIVGSVLPDVDILWFYLVDNQSTHHHSYITHRPILWFAILAFGATFSSSLLKGLGTGGILHLGLDSIAGHVAWLWPISDAGLTLVEVQPTHDHWILSFLAHWTFKVEIALTVVALVVFIYSRLKSGRAT